MPVPSRLATTQTRTPLLQLPRASEERVESHFEARASRWEGLSEAIEGKVISSARKNWLVTSNSLSRNQSIGPRVQDPGFTSICLRDILVLPRQKG